MKRTIRLLALEQAGKEIPFRTVVLSIDGAILEER